MGVLVIGTFWENQGRLIVWITQQGSQDNLDAWLGVTPYAARISTLAKPA